MSDESGMMNGSSKRRGGSGDLMSRTKGFALRVLRVYESLPKSAAAQVLGKQVLRSGTSVGAHYREACRARSTAEFISKLEVGLQELEESTYWLELLIEAGFVSHARLVTLLDEADQLAAMLAASAKTIKSKRRTNSR
jgi:four helix bundle protein